MPESLAGGPRLYTIPPSAPFLTTLARAILAGELPSPGGAKPDPLTLPLTTIYLPTRRAARALREAFLAEAKGEALLLPRIRTLGDPDEEAAIIFGADDAARADGGFGAPAIGDAATASRADAARACLREATSHGGSGRDARLGPPVEVCRRAGLAILPPTSPA